MIFNFNFIKKNFFFSKINGLLIRFSLKSFFSPMMQKYPSTSLNQNENLVKPSNEALSFLLMYSKSIEVKKGKKQRIILCKN